MIRAWLSVWLSLGLEAFAVWRLERWRRGQQARYEARCRAQRRAYLAWLAGRELPGSPKTPLDGSWAALMAARPETGP